MDLRWKTDRGKKREWQMAGNTHHSHTFSLSLSHTHKHAHINQHNKCIPPHLNQHDKCTLPLSFTCTYTHTQSHTHRVTHTHTHKYTHTHTNFSVADCCSSWQSRRMLEPPLGSWARMCMRIWLYRYVCSPWHTIFCQTHGQSHTVPSQIHQPFTEFQDYSFFPNSGTKYDRFPHLFNF